MKGSPMGLKSKLFSGDSKLEAAAISDPAHIKGGASGKHVAKIQRALILLDGATIPDDELRREFYGVRTSDAVLAYKQKRNIINRSYQASADNIVGRMTMARLDDEMVNWEALKHAPVRIRPLSYSRPRPPRSPHLVALVQRARPLELNFALGLNFKGLRPGPLPIHFLPQNVLVLDRNSRGKFEVLNGAGGDIKILDRDLVLIAESVDPSFVGPLRFTDRFVIQNNPQFYEVESFMNLGEAELSVTTPTDIASSFVVVTKLFPSPPAFHFTEPHNHQPCGRWADIRAAPNSIEPLAAASCRMSNQPQDVMDAAKLFMRQHNAPLAVEHLDRYLAGSGADFDEGVNILHWLKQDSNIRNRLKREIFPGGKQRVPEGHFTFKRGDFGNNNFFLSFGEIDRVDFAVDFSDDTVRVWFQDRYEFRLCSRICGQILRKELSAWLN